MGMRMREPLGEMLGYFTVDAEALDELDIHGGRIVFTAENVDA